MTKNKIRSIIELVSHGWRAYSAAPQSVIYARLGCQYAPESEDGKKKRESVKRRMICCLRFIAPQQYFHENH